MFIQYLYKEYSRKSKSKENVGAELNAHTAKTLHDLQNNNGLVLSLMTVHFRDYPRAF